MVDGNEPQKSKTITINCDDFSSDGDAIQHAINIVSKRKTTVESILCPTEPLVIVRKGHGHD